jgi:hypothetical protein
MSSVSFSISNLTGLEDKKSKCLTRINIDPEVSATVTSITHTGNIVDIHLDALVTQDEIRVINSIYRIVFFNRVVGINQKANNKYINVKDSIGTLIPTATHDILSGYAPGSRVFNSATKTFYICLDNTESNAKWVKLASSFVSTGTVEVLDLITGEGQSFSSKYAWHDFTWSTVRFENTGYIGFTPDEPDIKVLKSGIYLINAGFSLTSNKTSRIHGQIKLSIKNSEGNYEEILGTRSYVYLRTKKVGNQSVSICWRESIAANTCLKFEIGHTYGSADIESIEYSRVNLFLLEET